MGIRGQSGLAGALFTPVQQRVLALLFSQPDRRFQSAELIRLARGGTGAVHRQLSRLADAGLVVVTRTGNQKHYQANRKSPIFAELRGLIAKTAGIVEPLRRALMPVAKDVRIAFVYGSVAKGTDTASSDIDLMIVSDRLRYPDVFRMLQKTESALARRVNPTVLTFSEFQAKRATADSFVARVAKRPKLFVIGSDEDVS